MGRGLGLRRGQGGRSWGKGEGQAGGRADGRRGEGASRVHI